MVNKRAGFRLDVYRRKNFLASIPKRSEGNLLAAELTEPNFFLGEN